VDLDIWNGSPSERLYPVPVETFPAHALQSWVSLKHPVIRDPVSTPYPVPITPSKSSQSHFSTFSLDWQATILTLSAFSW